MHDVLRPSSSIKGLIFDLDGTLADTMPIHMEAWKRTGDEFDVTITEKMIIDRAGTPTVQVIEQLNDLFGWGIDPFVFRKAKNRNYQSVKESWGPIRPIHHVMEIANTYRSKLPMSIGTGSIRRNAEMALRDLGVSVWFSPVITAEDVLNHKPHPDTFLKCSSLMGIKPGECLVYEDGLMGIKAAVNAGMSAINIQTMEIFSPTSELSNL